MMKPATTAPTAKLAALADAAVVRSIGNTPLVRLHRFERHLGLPESIEIHLKTEWVNPGGSIKDRAALAIPVTLVVPESASDERKRTLAAYGATVVYSDPYEGSDGAIRLVRELVANGSDQFFYADQYNNPANAAA